MGMRNPEQPKKQRLSLNYTHPVGPSEPAGPEFPVASVYVRVSSPGQEDGTSMDVQAELCWERLESEGYRTREELIYREVWTGADKERPELARLMADVRAGKMQAVFVYHIDRWSRDPLHCLQLFDELLSYGVQLRPVQGTLEDTPEGRLILYVQGFAGQQERLRFMERTRAGKAAAARMGRMPNGTGAGLYGYDYDKTDKVRVVKDDEANVVRLIFQWACEGVSTYQIALRLNELGIPTKRGSKWHPLGVRRILENRAYTGVQFYGENRYRKVSGGKRKVTANPSSEVIRIEGFTPAIIPEEVYELARERMESRQAVVKESGRQYLLTGFVRCLFCGGRVVGACLSGKYRYYRCRATTPTSTQAATCDAKYIPADELEEWVYERLSEIVRDPDILAVELEGHLLEGVGDTSGEIASLKREIRDLAQQQGRLMDQLGNELIDQEILESRIAPIKALYDEKRRLLRVLEEQERLRDDAALVRERVTEYCRQLEEKLEHLDFEGRRALLGVFGVRVEASRDDVSMTVVLDPKYAAFTTIAQTWALRRGRNRRCRLA